MLNVKLSVLQTLDQREWRTTSEISEQTRIQKGVAERALSDLNENGIVETRESGMFSESGFSSLEWRSIEGSLSAFLEANVPSY